MKTETFLEERHCQFERVPHSPAFSAQRLAQQLHVPGQEVAKTVLLRSGRGRKFVVAVLPASKSIDLAAASKLVGRGALQLATELEIGEHCPDCEFGVLPPFGSRYGMKTIVDSSLTQDEEIVFAADTHDVAVRMKFEEFRELEDPQIGQFAVSA